MTINCKPARLAAEIAGTIQKAVPSEPDIEEIRGLILSGGDEATPELMVECFYRCLLTDDFQQRFQIGLDDLPRCINSSHVPTRRMCCERSRHPDPSILIKKSYRAWLQMKEQYPKKVGMYVPGKYGGKSLRHADLYMITEGQIVSIEFKYVGPHGVRNPKAVADQMHLYVKHHAATLLVIYSGSKEGSEVRGLARLRGLLDPAVPVVLVYGRAIPSAPKR